MRALTFTAVLLSVGTLSLADTKPPTIKSWKTFQSDWGFEFKYPDCWKVVVSEAGFETKLESSPLLAVEQLPDCGRDRLVPNIPNSIGFSVAQRKGDSKGSWVVTPFARNDDALNEIRRHEERARIAIQRKDWMIYKKNKVGQVDVEVWVEYLPGLDHNDIRWIWTVYCPSWWISVGGPAIRNPDKSYFEKFKSGDLALPEPEKTLIESFRCTKPKLKPGMKIPLSH